MLREHPELNMKPQRPVAVAAAAALAALHSSDPRTLEKAFGHLTPPALATLDKLLIDELSSSPSSSSLRSAVDDNFVSADTSTFQFSNEECNRVVAKAVIRRMVHQSLAKYKNIHSSTEVEQALKYHSLPRHLQLELAEIHGGLNVGSEHNQNLPSTWFDALAQLKEIAASSSSSRHITNGNGNKMSRNSLWRLILDHPMTGYVPVQCQKCGHVVPDETKSKLTDEDVGLTEVEPTPAMESVENIGEEQEILELRGGWFRGPRRPVVFVLNCPKCNAVSRWYRSSHPKIILNPNRWGRLCGEQEDLRLDLASYLNIQIRTCVPLDWDHIWSEFREDHNDEQERQGVDSKSSGGWQVHDPNARNFAVRLDEGIGSWTGVLAISPIPELCSDVTDDYLQCTQINDVGRADIEHESQMYRYRNMVQKARHDSTGTVTQAGTLNGYVIQRANFTSRDITNEMQKAASEYGTKDWWQV